VDDADAGVAKGGVLRVTSGVDEARGRIRLTPQQLAALALVARGESADGPESVVALSELRAAGILDDERRVHPLAADLAWTSAVPTLRMLVETSCAQGPAVAHVVVSNESVWYSEPWPGAGPDAPVPYQRAELPTIVWDLGRLVGLHRMPVAEDAVVLEAPVGVVDSVLTAVSSDAQEWDLARAVALTRGRELWPALTDETLERWMTLVASIRSWWRITIGWGPTGLSTGEPVPGRWLSVLDCGPEGYWRWDIPDGLPATGDLASGSLTRLVPVSGADLWKDIANLLPSGAEIRTEIDREKAGSR
jgi:hypothetical protein